MTTLPEQPEKQGLPVEESTTPLKPEQAIRTVAVRKHRDWRKVGSLCIVLLIMMIGGIEIAIHRHQLADSSSGQYSQSLTSSQKAEKQLLTSAQADLGFDKPSSGGYTVSGGGANCKNNHLASNDATDPCAVTTHMAFVYQYSTKWPSLTAYASQIKLRSWRYEDLDADVYSFYKVVQGKPVCTGLRSVDDPLHSQTSSLQVELHTLGCADDLASTVKTFSTFKLYIPQTMPARYTNIGGNIGVGTGDPPSATIGYTIPDKANASNPTSIVSISEDNGQSNSVARCGVQCKLVLTTPKGTEVREAYIDTFHQELAFNIGSTDIDIDRDIQSTTPPEDKLSDTELANVIDSMQVISPEQVNKLGLPF